VIGEQGYLVKVVLCYACSAIW